VTHTLLQTKLRPPPERHTRLPRPHLLRALEGARRCKLTLVSAPAGYGKSTLLADYARTAPTAWLDLDEADNDPRRFLIYLVGALEVAGVRTPAPTLNDADDPEGVLTGILNALLTPDALTLVLEDYGLIHAGGVHDAVCTLAEHAPPSVHLVLSTRTDPPLPLARWRAQGELFELRAADLRFSPEEVRGFLLEVMDLELSERDSRTLTERTEGWIAGVQLAGLSLRGKARPAEFIATFTGTDRFVLDYLTEEVLNKQPPEVQDFLVLTAPPPRLCGELCDAVTGGTGGAARLEALGRADLFLTPLDREGRWYRLHPFFADLLLHRLQATRPDLLPELHARASRWFEGHGFLPEALRHALLSGDPARAASLIAAHPRAQAVERELGVLMGSSGESLETLLTRALSQNVPLSRLFAPLEVPPAPSGHASDHLHEPLSEREREVLRLVAAGCPNKEIARRLGVSLNTVKTHTKNIHGKLGVSSRTQAAARARERGLL